MPSSIDAPIPAIWAMAEPHRDRPRRGRPKVACPFFPPCLPFLPSLPNPFLFPYLSIPLSLPTHSSLLACLFLFPYLSIPLPSLPILPRLLAPPPLPAHTHPIPQ